MEGVWVRCAEPGEAAPADEGRGAGTIDKAPATGSTMAFYLVLRATPVYKQPLFSAAPAEGAVIEPARINEGARFNAKGP